MFNFVDENWKWGRNVDTWVEFGSTQKTFEIAISSIGYCLVSLTKGSGRIRADNLVNDSRINSYFCHCPWSSFAGIKIFTFSGRTPSSGKWQFRRTATNYVVWDQRSGIETFLTGNVMVLGQLPWPRTWDLCKPWKAKCHVFYRVSKVLVGG